MAESDPQTYLPVLAVGLGALAGTLRECKQYEDALVADEEAVALYRTLAERDPHAYTRDFSFRLDRLSENLAQLGRHAEALDAQEESHAVAAGLFVQDSNRLFILADTLRVLIERRHAAGQHAGALAAARDAVDLARRFTAIQPERGHYLVWYLDLLADQLAWAGQHDEALETAEESVAVSRHLATDRQHKHLMGLADSLSKVSAEYAVLGRTAEAHVTAAQCVFIYRQRFEHLGDSVSRILADSLRILADRSTAAGRPHEAVAATSEADALMDDLRRKYPGRARGDGAS
ncbi:tetratricopeptide repeat protein [Nocardia sp. NPDC050412]|uniref:tetratricopeptide repeat protein n=1 Tax=Nocardia sp. NPDC050412 TaxID=3364320 RepID=UPI003798F33B